MKISPVSFYGIRNNNNINKKPQPEQKAEKTPEEIAQAKHDRAYRTFFASTMFAIMLAGLAVGSKTDENYGKLVIPFDYSKQNITELAHTYNVSEDAILAYNDLKESSDAKSLKSIKIPSSYDYIQPKIEKLQEKLFSLTLSDKERLDIEAQISELLDKEEEQKSVATLYKDNSNIYILINIKEDAPERIKEKYALGINIESLKKLFDIRNGAIENNNPLNAQWQPTDSSGEKGYFDYTLNWFHNGDIIKIPIGSIED